MEEAGGEGYGLRRGGLVDMLLLRDEHVTIYELCLRCTYEITYGTEAEWSKRFKIAAATSPFSYCI